MATQTTVVHFDAQAEELAIYRVDPSTGAPISGAGAIRIKLPDLIAAMPAGDQVTLGLIHYVDSQDGLTKKVICLLGTPTVESPPANGGANSNVWAL